ncbi:MAG: right-handed parallel beta-helix repeat-containing protein [Candidatus Freyarchaeota archaeon]|nr:right-handed parallel beta-helix repeat-containing protein [Candidatus Jordarchaeia archaeon]
MKVVVKDNEADLARIIRNASSGDEILLEKGDYVVDDVLVETDLAITGKGNGLTRLSLEGHGFICDGVRKFRIESLTLIGSKDSEILSLKYGRVEATNCDFTGCELSSLQVEVGIAKFERCHFYRNGYGVLLGEGSIISVKDCKFSENQIAAIWIKGGDLRVEGSLFQENGLGVAVVWSSRAKLIGNTFLNHPIDPAVAVMERADAIVSGNSFSNCRCGVLVSRHSTAVIENNTFTSCGDARTPVLSISGNCSIKGDVLESNKFLELRGPPLATCVGGISEKQP